MPRRALARPATDSRGDVEWLLVLVLIALRGTIVLPAALAAPEALSDATHPGRYVAVSVATLLFGAVLIAGWLRRRRADSATWGWLDVGFGLAVIVLNASCFPAGMQIGTWAVWAPAYLVTVTLTSVAWASPRTTLGLAAMLGGVYIATIAVTSEDQLALSIYNAAGYLVLAGVTSGGAALLRRYAREADEAREEAAAAAAALENERYRAVVHDTTGLLRLLATDGLPAPVLEVLREQALAESARLRAYVDDPGAADARCDCTLGPLVRGVLEGFRDLPIEPALMLGSHARVAPAAAATLERALVTVLHNVRRHARAEQVVVHADARDGRWEVTVSDDGVGFDPATQPLGFGLATQVLAQATAAGLDVDLRSAPGVGTTVVLSGPDATQCAEPAAPQPRGERQHA